jgi:ApeA-like protein/HEPN superfamily Apea-like protein
VATSTSDMDVQGNWWTPGQEEHSVQGVLRVNEDGATLELAGELALREQTPGEIVQGEVVLGRDETGRAITLLDASTRTRHIGPQDRMTVQAYTALVGRAHPARDPVFQACGFSLDGLAEWAESHFRLLYAVADASGPPQGERDSDRISFDVPEGKLTLFAGLGRRLSDIERSFKVQSSWLYELAVPKSLDDIWREAIRPLEYLHVLLTAEPTKAFDVSLTLPSEPGTPRHEQVSLKVYAGWSRGGSDVGGRAWEWPVRLNEIADRLPEIVRSWLELVSLTEPALVLLFAVLRREKDLYLENRYLTLAQAAEAFHRRHPKFPSRIISEDEFAERLEVLREVAERAGWWGSWLRARVQYAYEPTFRQRLRDLVAEGGKFAEEVFSRDVIDRVVRRRNELTHVLDAKGEPDQRYAELAMLGEKISLLLTACLLVNLGFRDHETRAALTRNPHQEFVADFTFG